ncbi:MAG: dephospho-CoA kinase [candidate division Zixibacteria bacterium]|nr:dephospho-CoA kinase [candidate division Zixibacteria bacterium]
MVIGLTGQIGAGKTTVANILRKLGARIIDADLIGRQVVDNSAALLKKLTRAFGPEILDSSGKLDRRRLAALAFASEAGKRKLNDLVHPYLLRELRAQRRAAEKDHALVVIDAALLLFWEMDEEVDYVLVVHAGEKRRLERLTGRGISPRDARSRQRAQLPFKEFQKRADHVLMNHRDPADLERRLRKLLARIIPAIN